MRHPKHCRVSKWMLEKYHKYAYGAFQYVLLDILNLNMPFFLCLVHFNKTRAWPRICSILMNRREEEPSLQCVKSRGKRAISCGCVLS